MSLAAALALAALLAGAAGGAQAQTEGPAPGAVRIATFNMSLSRQGAGLAWKAIADGADQPRAIAAIVRRVRPDILLALELDHDPEGLALSALARLLAEAEGDLPGVEYPHLWTAPSNTGVPTGLDLDRDGSAAGPGDAQGYGLFPGQYGMAILSRLPIDAAAARTFQRLLWRDMPGALIPQGHYPEGAEDVLRLSSKSHWDVPVVLPDGRRLHLLVSHPTPPVFDGPEDRNGRRNHDEVRFWVDYIDGRDWMRDDQGRAGGLAPGAAFVVAGDLNADPEDGDGRRGAIRALIGHERVQDPRPRSKGAAAAAAQGGANRRHRADPALDTADWRDAPGPGNLRVDFALPSTDWRVTGAGVYWPAPGTPEAALVTGGRRPASSDHRLVWIDLR